MKGKTILFVLVMAIVVFLNLNSFAQPFEPCEVTSSTIINNTDTSSAIERTRYIAVDQNRVVSNIAKGQRVENVDKSKYNITVDSSQLPLYTTKQARLETRDEIMFGRGMGADQDLIRNYDANGNGAMDARQAHNIREDTSY